MTQDMNQIMMTGRMKMTIGKKYLVMMESAEDTETEWFDQVVEALTDKGIGAVVVELEEDYS